MKKAAVVSIGNEILCGHILDTNLSYLSRMLFQVALPVAGAYTVPDELDSIVRGLELAFEQADVVVCTGGLGPTGDDLTRRAIAKFLGVELELREELLQQITIFFQRRGHSMPECNRVQAYIPAGAEALPNDLGTAPGIKAKVDDKLLIALPGVPAEARWMFEKYVLSQLKELARYQAVAVRKLRCFGSGESDIAELLGAAVLSRDRNPLVNITVADGVITVTITAIAGEAAEAERLVERDESLFCARLGELVFGRGDEELAEVVGRELALRKKTIAVAESCTGGLVAKLLTDIPGSSRYFTFGWVTYSNRAKVEELGVRQELIEGYGAVSEQVAEAMALGARERAKADFAVATTGIAGPGGANEQKPVGLIYISVSGERGCETHRFILPGQRDSIRFRAAQTALNLVRLRLKRQQSD